jgi:hypothetical protein
MTKQHIPSTDPANEGDLSGVFRHVMGKFTEQLDVMLPAKVISYDRGTNRATVQPLIKVLTTGSPTVGISRATIINIPVYQIGCGQFTLNFPIQAGDLGWIHACDRDISIFAQGGTESAPNTLRKHNFADSVFYPDSIGGWSISDSSAAVLQTKDGNISVSVGASAVTLKAGGSSMVVSSSGVAITGGTVTHNGINIGATHVHSGVTAGTANTGVPQ